MYVYTYYVYLYVCAYLNPKPHRLRSTRHLVAQCIQLMICSCGRGQSLKFGSFRPSLVSSCFCHFCLSAPIIPRYQSPRIRNPLSWKRASSTRSSLGCLQRCLSAWGDKFIATRSFQRKSQAHCRCFLCGATSASAKQLAACNEHTALVAALSPTAKETFASNGAELSQLATP